ncbi:MAG TPA: hypothetical protein VM936_15590 [Pyrinomonadaceae bacterium]|nr:hypothetical protein [Pyrinomonadaceae bacterium]
MTAVYWYWVVGTWLVLYPVVYLSPRFMSLLGLCVTGIFFLVVIVAQWVASWVFGPCQW